MEFIGAIIKNVIVTAIVGYFCFLWGKRKINVKLKTNILRTPEEKDKNAQRGLILLTSLYSQTKVPDDKNLSPGEIKQAIKEKDYKKLDLENSNLGHNIEAILTHKTKLKHCWIIGSYAGDKNIPCSLDYEEILVEYLKNEGAVNCEFHYGSRYAVPLDDDSLVCYKTREIIEEIFEDAKINQGLKPSQMIADVTGGTKSMNLGVIMACMHEDNDIQIMGSKYNSLGKPTDKPYPIRIHFVPKVNK